MARYQILPTDPVAVKLWSTKVAIDAANKMYYGKMTGTEEDAMPVVTKTDLESGAGDEVTTTLIAKFTGKPIEGSEKGEGREDKLSHYTHKMRVDKHRKLVNLGDIMDQKRAKWSIAKQARNRLSDYLAEISDQRITMYASGARGVGDEINHYPTDYTGFPNAFDVPDAKHNLVGGTGGIKTKATLAATDLMSTLMIDRALVRAKKFYGTPGKAVRMTQINVEGGKHYLMLMSPDQMYDLRREVGDAGWLTLEKAKAAQDGAKNPIFTGGSAYYNGVLLDEVQHFVKFSDYGAGSDVAAARALFWGAHGVAVAYGTRGQRENMRYELRDSDLDHGEEDVIVARMIEGVSKCRWNSLDYGIIAVDTSYTTGLD